MSISVRFELCHLESGSNCGILCSVRIVSSSVRVASFSVQNVTFCVRLRHLMFELLHLVSGSNRVN